MKIRAAGTPVDELLKYLETDNTQLFFSYTFLLSFDFVLLCFLLYRVAQPEKTTIPPEKEHVTELSIIPNVVTVDILPQVSLFILLIVSFQIFHN